MITITRSYQVTNGRTPYSYVWSGNNSCIAFSTTSGTSYDGFITTQISFTNEACLNAAIITLSVTDADGCTNQIGVSITNPCTNFNAGEISISDPYSFSVLANSPGCRSLTFYWYYDTAVFEQVSLVNSNGGSNLVLDIRDGLSSYPLSSQVSVLITDCNGCTEIRTVSATICSGTAQDFGVQLYCTEDNNGFIFISSLIRFPDPTGCSTTWDWSTLQINLPSGWQFIGSGGSGYFTAPSGTAEGNYAANYSLEDANGVPTDLGQVSFYVNPCDTGNTIFIPDRVIDVACDAEPLDVITINIEDDPVVASGVDIDWDTWAIVFPDPAPGNITLSTDVNGDHVILYELPDPIIAGVFGYTVCTTEGNCAQTAIYTVIPCPTSPVAVNDAACAYCGESTIIPVLDNDVIASAPFDVTTIGIVDYPTKGTVSLPDNGTVVYIPNVGETGTDTFTYSVSDTSGGVSNVATVTIDIICAGESNSVVTCQ